VFTHPFASVPVTVNVVEALPSNVTFEPVETFNPVEGLQVYDTAPVAVKFIGTFWQVAGETGEITIVGRGLTLINPDMVFVSEPEVSVTVSDTSYWPAVEKVTTGF